MARTPWADQLRELARTLSEDGQKEVTSSALFLAIGAVDVGMKARVRRSLTHMVERGELTRVKNGVFRFSTQADQITKRYGDSFPRMWRIIRTENSGWSIRTIAGTTRLHPSTVQAYCQWLEEEKLITRCGKKGNAFLYRATNKARLQRDTPYPPVLPKDPYAKERSAACRLVRLFMNIDPGKNRENIITECRAILARFEQEENNAE